MSFQDEYKITSADRLDKGVYGLPDTPGMTTAAIQERFDSLGNLAIDKFNALVEAASDVIDGSDTKFPTNKAVEDYISGEGGAIIDDTTPSLHKAYSSQKVENMFGDVASRVIDDTEPLSNKTYSSEEIEEKLSNIPSPESIIDDDTASSDTTYSSSKLESDFISVSDTEEQTATDEFTTINGGLLSSLKVSLEPIQDLHGYDNPWVGGAGKNKINCNAPTVTRDGVTVTNNGDGTFTVTGTRDTSTGSTDFYLTNNGSADLIPLGDITDGYLVTGCPNGGGTSSYQLIIGSLNSRYATDSGNGDALTNVLQAGIRVILRIFSNYSFPTGGLTFKPMIRASGASADFEPYSNICPISGHTQAKVGDDGKNRFNPNSYESFDITGGGVIRYGHEFDSGVYTLINNGTGVSGYFYRIVAKDYSSYGTSVQITNNTSVNVTVDDAHFLRVFTAAWDATAENIAVIEGTDEIFVPYNGYQITVNLGGTYYSGILDVVSGVFTPDTAFDTLSADNFNGETGTSGGGLHYYDWNNGLSKKSGICLCSMMPQNNTLAWQSTTPCIQMSSGGGHIRCYVEEATKEAFKTAYSGMQICYELDNPLTIQLSPTMVKALVGENHLSAPLDGQEITESVYSPLAKWNAVIDDTTASDDTTYSSDKINTIVPKIDDNSTSASKVFSSLKTANLITELSERFDFSTTEKPLGWWTDGKVYYGKVINIAGCPKEMFGLVVDLGVEVDTFIGIFAVGDAKDDNYNGGYCMGGTIYCKVIKSEGQNTQIQPACAVMALGGASLLVLYTKVE